MSNNNRPENNQSNGTRRRHSNNGATHRPRVTQWRLDSTLFGVVAVAIALVIYDAYVSFLGFQGLGLEGHGPFIFAGLIFITQMGVGVLHAVGEDFRDVKAGSDTEFLNNIWSWILFIIYGTDIASNAFEFGLVEYLSRAMSAPVEGLGGGALVLALATMLCFGDEILLRVFDKLNLARAKNRASAKRHNAAIAASNTYVQYYQERAVQDAESEGRRNGGYQFGDGL